MLTFQWCSWAYLSINRLAVKFRCIWCGGGIISAHSHSCQRYHAFSRSLVQSDQYGHSSQGKKKGGSDVGQDGQTLLQGSWGISMCRKLMAGISIFPPSKIRRWSRGIYTLFVLKQGNKLLQRGKAGRRLILRRNLYPNHRLVCKVQTAVCHLWSRVCCWPIQILLDSFFC